MTVKNSARKPQWQPPDAPVRTDSNNYYHYRYDYCYLLQVITVTATRTPSVRTQLRLFESSDLLNCTIYTRAPRRRPKKHVLFPYGCPYLHIIVIIIIVGAIILSEIRRPASSSRMYYTRQSRTYTLLFVHFRIHIPKRVPTACNLIGRPIRYDSVF